MFCFFILLVFPHKAGSAPLKLRGGVVQAHQSGWLFVGGGVSLAAENLALSAGAMVGNLSTGQMALSGPITVSGSGLHLRAQSAALTLSPQHMQAHNISVMTFPYHLRAGWFISSAGERRIGQVQLTPMNEALARRVRLVSPYAQLARNNRLKLRQPALYIENTKVLRLPRLVLGLDQIQSLADTQTTPAFDRYGETRFGAIGDRGLSLRRLEHVPVFRPTRISLLLGSVFSTHSGEEPPADPLAHKSAALGAVGFEAMGVQVLWGRDFFVDELGHAHLVSMAPFAWRHWQGGRGGLNWRLDTAAGGLQDHGAGVSLRMAHGMITVARPLWHRGRWGLRTQGQSLYTRYGTGGLSAGAENFFGATRVSLVFGRKEKGPFGSFLETGMRWTADTQGAPATSFEGADESTRVWMKGGLPFSKNRWRLVSHFEFRKRVVGHDVKSVELQKNYALYHLYARYSLMSGGFTLGVRMNPSDLFQPAPRPVIQSQEFWPW